jgi:hypothetical protein
MTTVFTAGHSRHTVEHVVSLLRTGPKVRSSVGRMVPWTTGAAPRLPTSRPVSRGSSSYIPVGILGNGLGVD